MKADGEHPLVEQSARGLGVRAGGGNADVYPDDDEKVHPGDGMSVTVVAEMRFGAEVANWGAHRRGVLDRLIGRSGCRAAPR
ncbi:MAG: hypothetical protein ACR2G7_00305 [Acidimicrobiales bacterium]